MGITIFRPGRRVVIPSPGVQVWTPGIAAAASYVLDGISNVAAAYSLRKLRSAYAGSAVRVRRSSDSTEQDIGFASDGEFDTAAFSSFIGGGTGYVKTWYDQSGNSRDLSQSTTDSQASIVLSILNSKPGLSFDGTNDFLRTSAFTLNQPAHFVILLKLRTAVLNDYYFDGFSGDNSSLIETGPGSAADSATMYSGGYGANVSIGTTNFNILSVLYSGASSEIRVNGGGRAASATGTTAPGGFTLATWGLGTSTRAAAISVPEVIILSAALSSPNHNTIGTDMANRYGLSWTTVT